MKEENWLRRDHAPFPLVDDAATSISTGMNDTIDSDSIILERMPLLNYFRLGSSGIQRANSEATLDHNGDRDLICTCSAMAQVTVATSGLISAPEGSARASSDYGNHDIDPQQLLTSDLWKHPYHVIASGLDDGSIVFRSAYSGAALINEEKFKIQGDQSAPSPVVDLAFDSTGTIFTAIDLDGHVAIWELKYSASVQQPDTHGNQLARSSPRAPTDAPSSTNHEAENGNAFSSLLSALKGNPVSQSDGMESQGTESPPSFQPSVLPCLSVDVVTVSRSRYPNSWAKPTCITIDPASKRSREKSFITGFQDGRLVLTRRGGLFQRRNDTVIYHGIPDSSGNDTRYQGIESMTWRGSFLAWADASGIKLLDIGSLRRIAHIDRPSGARPTLYPSISALRPALVFERSHSLLVSWGDCLMAIEIEESKEPSDGNKKCSVECSMAWELDCVSCGVVPLDNDHVIVLGLVPLEEDAESNAESSGGNDIEVQIVSRTDGTVIYCDSLQVQTLSMRNQEAGLVSEASTAYSLLSSFALPRMEDTLEAEEQKRQISVSVGELDTPALFSPALGEAANYRFKDAHSQWNLNSVCNNEGEEIACLDEDTESVDSDDYGFILRPMPERQARGENKASKGAPPVIIIVTPYDIIRSQTSTVDDAISHAISRNMNALALKHALHHKKELRSYSIADLIDNFLRSVLRLNSKDEVDNASLLDMRPLSLRRMRIALKCMSNLLGDQSSRWEKWVEELEAIPGVLFLLRESLPVRDPILPPPLYERLLIQMFEQAEDLLRAGSESLEKLMLYEEAVGHFLDSLLSWGPTNALEEYIRLYDSDREQCGTSHWRECQILETALRCRHEQSSQNYLKFPLTPTEFTAPNGAPGSPTEGVYKSLFSISNVLKRVVQHVPIVALPGELEDGLDSEDIHKQVNSRLSFETMARFRMMQQNYEEALRCYLMIGLHHGDTPIQLIERLAIKTTKERHVDCPDVEKRLFSRHEFVLDLIEYYHLHRFLLDGQYLSGNYLPLFALIQLIGLNRVGRFLMDHCASPELLSLEVRFDGKERELLQKGTLPMDLVARQLERSPSLLYWYLNLIFIQKPELYIRFPNHYIPPKTVTELHRKHLDLHVKFAGGDKFSDRAFLGVEKYDVNTFSTPLLSFLKAAVPVGGLSSVEVRRLLETHRSGEVSSSDEPLSAQTSSCFALELAFVIENYSEQSETEATGVLDLYLKGVNSLNLAVSYVQRQQQHSFLLWEKLINYCLNDVSEKQDGKGALFGALLESSAVYGADLSRLVARIPAGMVVEGLRPRLVSAIADYRLKQGVHKAALAVSEEEKISLQRQVAHRSKRGVRHYPYWKSLNDVAMDATDYLRKESQSKKIGMMKTKLRRDRYRLSYSIPMR